jgi:DEAD/DEAH box helicase domain-containing protein
MLPIIVSRQIVEGLKTFLRITFPITTKVFRFHSSRTLIDDFLDKDGNLAKGPWLEVKLPYRTAETGETLPFSRYSIPFTPYQHQVRAFRRLTGSGARSTIVATGTGSGKTECFMYPILDYCLSHRHSGIKAIIIYPMNALATDQARRFAKECSKLDIKLSVGLFTGDDGSNNRGMTPEQVITHRESLRDNPPDILLTNYKMLDFLLMRPQDQRLWQFNTPGVLRYLVVDELHTFDGAQGTDLACLIRRLRDKLSAGDEMACVGTSATIGDASAVADLKDYAEQVFAMPFDDDAIVLEDRLAVDEYLSRHGAHQEVIARWPVESLAELRPGESEAGVYLRRAAELWLGQSLALDAADESARIKASVLLGEQLLRLTAFQELLRQAHVLCDARELANEWQQRLRLPDQEAAETLIDSLAALISAARRWKNPGYDVKRPVTKDDVEPFLQVRVQLWLRELRRMVASVSENPELTHADDLRNLADPLHLPLLHCRECHAVAWGSVVAEGERRIKPDLQGFYQSWFAQKPDAALFFPLDSERGRADNERVWLCVRCHQLSPLKGSNVCTGCEGERIAVWAPDIRKPVQRNGINRTVVSADCPCCSGHKSLSVIGSRAASLSSVMIGELFGSSFNDDYKLIAFSDSVQDAAHRAGFFGARTYSQTLRNALARYIRSQGEGLSLPRLAQEFPNFWRQSLGSDEAFVGTFIAPNMEWLQGYQELRANGKIPSGSDVANLVSKRLSWEVISEFGLRCRIGRTLERSAVATVVPDNDRLQNSCDRLTHRLREELGMLLDVAALDVRYFLLGMLTRLRQKGAFYTKELETYVKEGGKEFLLTRLPFMPGYGFGNRPPSMLSVDPVSTNFENLLSQSAWYRDWFNKCLAADQPLASAEYQQAYTITLDVLEKDGWLHAMPVRQQMVWGLNPSQWQVTTQMVDVACKDCQHRLPTPSRQLHWLIGMKCVRQGCFGHYQPAPMQARSGHYRAWPRRLVPSEHTGLLDGDKRHVIESSFIEGGNSWDINLLSATPTLEMGINIGDLSTVLLCSVPPAQANYLQRIGRAGRRDGNALAVTIATGHRHDLYFYTSPKEMMEGQISPPGVFLQAMAVLERQLIAFCFDRWVATGVDASAIPGTLQMVLDTVEAGRLDGFPHNMLKFVDEHGLSILDRFLVLFPDLDDEGIEHIRQFLLGSKTEGALGWRILNRLSELVETRKSVRGRADELKKRIAQLEAQPADEARDQLLADSRSERGALLALISSINRRLTLNFFTDEGLLPNYAFPEEGVTLNSVILRRKETRDEGNERKRYEALSFSFQRSAQAALGELVPEARFYAAEHQLNIEQVDLKLSKPQTWRLCPSCHYNENLEESGDPHGVCPRCGNAQWADTGQKRTLLKLRQVYARADARNDRIGDDNDQREPVFYQRQLLVDVPPVSMQGGYRIAGDELPFGFEYLRNARFREINFGEPGDSAETFHVAGRSDARKGFVICRHCGMVRRLRLRKGQYAHTLDCPLSKPGAQVSESDWISSLYLYRELNSEAIRILLPLADVAQSEVRRTSFIAALNMGLRQYFRGNVQHLEITEMSESGANGHSPRQYLVIYDRVPGGTGYLKELMRTPDNLMGLLEQAHDLLLNCSCADQADQDGCYHCILAYRDSRNMAAISRKAAIELLERILALRDQLQPVEQLSQIDMNSALGSPLEALFVSALSKSVGITKKTVNGKPGYWIHARREDGADQVWELEPQAKLGPSQDVLLQTIPDFMLRPVRENDLADLGEWALYLDGFGPHFNKQTEDTRKRLAVMRSGRRVWSLGWQDIPQIGQQPNSVINDYLLNHRQPAMLAQYDKLAERFEWQKAVKLEDALTAGPFKLFLAFLQKPAETLAQLQQITLCNTIGWLYLPSLKARLWDDPAMGLNSVVPGTVRQWLQTQEDAMAFGGLLKGIQTGTSPVDIAVYLPAAALSSKQRLLEEVGISVTLDDTAAAQTKEFEKIWRGFWHAVNVLQFAPYFTVATRTGVAQQMYENLLEGWPSSKQLKKSAALQTTDERWQEVYDLCQIDQFALEQLVAAGVDCPEVGLDLYLDSQVVATAELAWPNRSIALMMENRGELPNIPEWVMISVHSPDWMDQLLTLLTNPER